MHTWPHTPVYFVVVWIFRLSCLLYLMIFHRYHGGCKMWCSSDSPSSLQASSSRQSITIRVQSASIMWYWSFKLGPKDAQRPMEYLWSRYNGRLCLKQNWFPSHRLNWRPGRPRKLEGILLLIRVSSMYQVLGSAQAFLPPPPPQSPSSYPKPARSSPSWSPRAAVNSLELETRNRTYWGSIFLKKR